MAIPQSGSLLLAIPMELLQRITVHLDDDQHAILSTRLACKTLEAATFDRFAEKFFDSHHYCILYRVSLLRLYALLASSSRLMSRMRTVTFTACFFANSSYKYVQLALNQSQTDLKLAQIAAMKAYSQDQVEMLQTQMLPDAELIRTVLVVLREKCLGVEVDLSIRKNAKSSIPVHAKVLEAVAVLGIALTRLTVDPTTLNSADFDTLQSGLPACTSSLVKFCFANTNILGGLAESQELAYRRSHLLRSVLGSTNSLRDFTLDLSHYSNRRATGELTSELLLTYSYPMLQSLSLGGLNVTERAILNALASWGGQLEKVTFRVVRLTEIDGEGWADVLSTLAALPKLCEMALYAIYGRKNNSRHIFVDLRDLEHGQTTFSNAGVLRSHNNVLFSKDEVAAGLHELLGGGLKYY